ncbi:hypothetical protein B0A49_10752 [Cryomyces minteri]|uniref:Major facilitator superfamily (MFS) profile domain-containing protein n=1 Tax=Cryomyces minteri TaxID=331657 RepID=A0A4V5ND38_9PEZI|nr:hypothetical protein B0A49_10752 [Cryomyces minteri]
MSFSDDIKRAAPFSAYDGRKAAVVADHEVVTVMGLEDADEALAFLQNHPKAAEIAVQGQAILDDPVQLKKLIRKIDLTIAPLLAAVYFLQFLDKTALSYTAVVGIRTDTHLKGQDYSNLSIFTHTRFASWRIFYVAIGAMTIVMGFLVIMFLPDSPVKAKRFTDAEKVAALLRTKDNPSGTQNSHVKKAQVFETFKDGRVWLVCLSTMLSSIPNGGISNFSSILLTTFGYTSQQALIMSLPAGAVGAACVLLVGWLSDRWRDRSIVMLICIIPTILGASLMIGLDPNGVPKNKAGLLAASFMTGTFGAAFMVLLAWNASNIASHSKKVTTNAMIMISFAVGNILGTQTFQAKQAPGYIDGKISIIVTLSALCFVIVILRVYDDVLNKQNERKLAEMGEAEKKELKEKMAFADQTDRKNVFFKYTH